MEVKFDTPGHAVKFQISLQISLQTNLYGSEICSEECSEICNTRTQYYCLRVLQISLHFTTNFTEDISLFNRGQVFW